MAEIKIYKPNSNFQSIFGGFNTNRLSYREEIIKIVKNNLKLLGVPTSKRDYITCELLGLYWYDDGEAYLILTSFFVAIRNYYKTQGFTEKNVDLFCLGILKHTRFDYKDLNTLIDNILNTSSAYPI